MVQTLLSLRHSLIKDLLALDMYNDDKSPEGVLLDWYGHGTTHIEIKENDTMFFFYNSMIGLQFTESPFTVDHKFEEDCHALLPKGAIVVFTQIQSGK